MKSKRRKSWIDAMSDDALLSIIEHDSNLKSYDLSAQSIDAIGNASLPRAIDGKVMYAFWPDYWSKLKAEFRLLICKRDKKYAPLRKKLDSITKKSETAIVSTISAAMAVKFGVAAGILAPFCALCLVGVSRLGKEAFCSAIELKITAK
jgi:hypothetical protein